MPEPRFLNELITFFEKLPGVGKKTATRYAYYMIENYSYEEISEICKKLLKSFEDVHKCSQCGMLTAGNICEICSDETRNKQQILIVKDIKDLLSIEKTNMYKGLYFILGETILEFNSNTQIQKLIQKLENLVVNNKIKEAIIGTPLTPNGDVCAAFLTKILCKYNIIITRIGYGLPAGADLEYADELTIKRALDYRIKI